MDNELKILILEDVPSDAELIERELRRARIGFTSQRVETRDAFLKALVDFVPDLILSDYSLPSFDGMTALFLTKETLPSAPFIVVTGSLNEEIAVDCIKAGAMDYVIKENLVRLGPAIRSALEKKRTLEEKRRAEEALRVQTQELTRSNKELERFAYVASHDLQEPLRKIITFGDRLADHSQKTLDETAKDYLHRIQHAALRMRQLVEGLLQYARVTVPSEFFGEIDLDVLLREILLDLEVMIVRFKAKVDVDPLPKVKGDPLQLRQLFQNLITNALKFSDKERSPWVRICGKKLEDDFAEITVEDNGIGFDEAQKEKIFLPFQRLHDPQVFEGIGIGLAICHRIVQRHGGQITAKSVLGQGSVFTVTLPTEKKFR
jgi:signal transduction histidine kinase